MNQIRNIYRLQNTYRSFWLFIIIYSFGYLAKSSTIFPSQVGNYIMTFGLIGIIFNYLKLFKVRTENKYANVLFFFYMCWQIYAIIRGISTIDKNTFAWYIFYPYTLLSFLVPFVFKIPFNISYFKILFKYFYVLSLFLFVFVLLFFNMFYTNNNFAEQIIWTFGTGAGLLILTLEYHSIRYRIVGYTTVIVSLFLAALLARRNFIVTFGDFIIFSYLIYIFSRNQPLKTKFRKFITFLFFIVGVLFIYFANEDVLFGKLSGRLTENSREPVLDAYLLDMTTQDWIIGKGMEGTYYMPNFEENVDSRFLIENGYLQVILKTGIVGLVLFLLIALPAAFLGLIKSKNIISKAAGAIVFLWLIDMFPWGMPAMNIRYILLWTCISISYSKTIREIPDETISKLFKLDR